MGIQYIRRGLCRFVLFYAGCARSAGKVRNSLVSIAAIATVAFCLTNLSASPVRLTGARSLSRPGTRSVPLLRPGKPLASGSPDVLFIVSAYALGDAIEAASRMDMNAFYVTPVIPEEKRDIDSEKALRALRADPEQLVPVDDSTASDSVVFSPAVIVIGDWTNFFTSRSLCIPWTVMPEPVRNLIVQSVKAGAGLVYVNPVGVDGELGEAIGKAAPASAEFSVTAGFPFSLFKEITPSSISTGALGRGRIVVLNYRAQGLIPATRYHEYDFAYEECFYSLFLKAMRWAGGMPESALLRDVRTNNGRLDIKVDGRLTGKETVSATVWRGRLEMEQSLDCPVVNGTVSLAVDKALPRGTHLVSVVLRDAGGEVLDWLVTNLEVERSARISSFVLSGETYAEGEEVRGDIEVDGRRSGQMHLRLECRDGYNRLLFREQKPVASTKNSAYRTSFSFVPLYPMTVRHAVSVSLVADGTVIDTRQNVFYIPGVYRKKELLPLIIWSGYTGYPNHLYPEVLARCREIGFTTILNSGRGYAWEHGLFLAKANLRMTPQNMARIHMDDFNAPDAYRKKTGRPMLVRVPCTNDPAVRDRMEQRVQEYMRNTNINGPLIYMLGDEMALTPRKRDIPVDVCFCCHCLDGFRTMLKKTYPSLDGLNAVWGTGFTKWDEVVPATWEKAVQSGNYASWLAHRAFMSRTYADYFRFCAGIIRRDVPDALVGEDGLCAFLRAYGGLDWEEKMKAESVIVFYDNGDIPMSFTDRSTSIAGSIALGYGRPESAEQFRLWRALFHGNNAIMCFHAQGLILPDLTLTAQGIYIKKHLKEVMEGPGQVLASSEYLYSPVAVHYSQPSLELSFLLGKKAGFDLLALFKDNFFSWAYGLRDFGYVPRYVSRKQIEDGYLRRGGFKALILPLSFAMTDEEARQIREFVNAGGILLADAQTGLYTETGRKRKDGLLDDVFRVKRKDGGLIQQESEYVLNGIAYKGDLRETGVEIPAGTGSPVPYGRGTAYYLGGANIELSRETGNAVADILKRLGIMPALTVTGQNGRQITAETDHFRRGDIEYFGVMRLPVPLPAAAARGKDPNSILYPLLYEKSVDEIKTMAEEYRIAFPEKGYVYEVRGRRAFGYGVKISDMLAPGIANLYAVLPRRPETSVIVPDAVRRGEPLRYSVQSNIREFPLYAELLSPSGEIVDYGTKVLFAEPKQSGETVSLGIAPETGVWKLLVREVVTGRTIEKSFRIVPERDSQ